MVFGNNLIDFSANGVNVQVATQATNFIVPDLGTNPNPPTGGTPRRILPQTISKTYTGLTFTVELDGDSYIGCSRKTQKVMIMDLVVLVFLTLWIWIRPHHKQKAR